MLSGITLSIDADAYGLIQEIGNYLIDIANSNFTSALAGALFGAMAASHIAKKSNQADDLAKNLRSLNTSLVMAMATLNTAGSIMSQSTRPVRDRYHKVVADFEAHRKRPPAELQQQLFTLDFDLLTLPPANIPIEHLQSTVFGNANPPAKVIALVFALEDAVKLYNNANEHRNKLLTFFSTKTFPPGYRDADIYLGLNTAHGVNKEFPNNIKALHTYNKDMIYYSMRLIEEIHKHIVKIISKNKIKDFKAPIIDFSDAQRKGLIPSGEEYAQWESGFQELEETPSLIKKISTFMREKFSSKKPS